MRRTLGVLALTLSCGRTGSAPLGEVRVVVDTDLPATLTLRLRADVFAEDGRWLDARDIARSATTDWPVSFSVFLPDGATSAREVRVRLRVYPEGEVRDYLDTPRLVVGGRDVTPTTEPAPTVAIDRLVRVLIEPGVRGRTAVVLGGECAGVVSDLASLTTCLTGDPPEAAPLAVVDASNIDAVGPSQSGAFGRAPAPTPLREGQVAVEGGAFVLGGRQLFNAGTTTGGVALGATPTRLFVIAPLLVDSYEFTVARFRALLARGFEAPTLPSPDRDPKDFSDCSWSTQPADREDYPLTCVTVATARAACRFDGGDLPTEAEWEYVASAWGRDRKTTYPWGAAGPTCDAVTFGRLPSSVGQSGVECIQRGARVGARAVTEGPGDVTANTSGPVVFGLGANVAEWTRDSYVPFADPCWASAGRHDPTCGRPAPAPATVRGGSFATGVAETLVVFRHPVDSALGYRDIGFRCVARP